MKTIQRTSSMLRRIALAGLGATSLWTAALAHAAIASSTPGVFEGLQAAARVPVLPDALPLGKAPLAEPLVVAPRGCGGSCQRPAEPQVFPESILVAPGCPGCVRGHDATGTLGASSHRLSTAEGSPLLLAGGGPPIVVDSCRSGRCRS